MPLGHWTGVFFGSNMPSGHWTGEFVTHGTDPPVAFFIYTVLMAESICLCIDTGRPFLLPTNDPANLIYNWVNRAGVLAMMETALLPSS